MKPHSPIKIVLLSVVAAMISLATAASAADYTVTNTADSGPGSLRQAIFDSNANPPASPSVNTIAFAIPTSDPNFTGTIWNIFLTSGEPAITSNVVISGPGANKLTVRRSAAALFSIFTVNPGPTVTISGLTIFGGLGTSDSNGQQFGGGIYNSGTLTVTACTVQSNLADPSNAYGGGIYNLGSLNLERSTLSNNSALSGAGLYNNGTAIVTNSTFNRNRISNGSGGGIYNNGTLTVTNVTLSQNQAVTGGGIYNNSGTLYLRNSIVAAQLAGGDISGGGVFNDLGHNFLGGNPMLNALGNYGGPTQTMTPQSGSPVIDAGDNAVLSAPYNLATDQRGLARALPAGGTVDIGAVELDSLQSGNAFVVNTTDDLSYDSCGVAHCSLRDAFAAAAGHDGTITFSIPTTDPGYDATTGRYTIKPASAYTVGVYDVNNRLAVNGPGANTLTIDLQTAAFGFFVNRQTTFTLSGVTVSNAHSPGGGGAMFIEGYGPTKAILLDCVFSNNLAVNGGAIGVNGELYVARCAFINNSAVNSGTPADDLGNGGAIHYQQYGQALTVLDSTFVNNIASNRGGAIYHKCCSGPAVLVNNTIVGNTAADGGGYNSVSTDAAGDFRNNILFGNIAPIGPDVSGNTFSTGYNLIGNSSGASSLAATDLIGANPRLSTLGDHGGRTPTMSLMAGSPALNAGDPAFSGFAFNPPMDFDQRGQGFQRVAGPRIDIGALENQPPVARARNVTVPAGSNCQASVTAQQVNDGSSDPDGGDAITLTLSPSGPFAIGTHNVTLTATDLSGFSSSATAVVTVVDNTPPVITSITAPTPGHTNSSNCQAPVPNVLPGVHYTDCSVVTLTQSPAAGTLVGIGQRVITVTARDSANNTRTATTTFTVTAGPPTFTVSVTPGTVRQGGSVTFTTAYSNCASTAQAVALRISLTGPHGRTLMLTLPLIIPAGRAGSVSVPLVIPRSTPVGSYSLTLDVFVGNTQVGTSSAQLTVTHY